MKRNSRHLPFCRSTDRSRRPRNVRDYSAANVLPKTAGRKLNGPVLDEPIKADDSAEVTSPMSVRAIDALFGSKQQLNTLLDDLTA